MNTAVLIGLCFVSMYKFGLSTIAKSLAQPSQLISQLAFTSSYSPSRIVPKNFEVKATHALFETLNFITVAPTVLMPLFWRGITIVEFIPQRPNCLRRFTTATDP